MANVWGLGFRGEGPTIPDQRSSLYLLFVEPGWFVPSNCSSPGSLEFGSMLGRGCTGPALSAESGEGPWCLALPTSRLNSWRKELCVRCVGSPGGAPCRPVSPGLHPGCLFPLLIAIWILFAIRDIAVTTTTCPLLWVFHQDPWYTESVKFHLLFLSMSLHAQSYFPSPSPRLRPCV